VIILIEWNKRMRAKIYTDSWCSVCQMKQSSSSENNTSSSRYSQLQVFSESKFVVGQSLTDLITWLRKTAINEDYISSVQHLLPIIQLVSKYPSILTLISIRILNLKVSLSIYTFFIIIPSFLW